MRLEYSATWLHERPAFPLAGLLIMQPCREHLAQGRKVAHGRKLVESWRHEIVTPLDSKEQYTMMVGMLQARLAIHDQQYIRGLLQRSRPQPLRRPIRQYASQEAPAFASRRCQLVVAKTVSLLLAAVIEVWADSHVTVACSTDDMCENFRQHVDTFNSLTSTTGNANRNHITKADWIEVSHIFSTATNTPNVTKYPDILATTPT